MSSESPKPQVTVDDIARISALANERPVPVNRLVMELLITMQKLSSGGSVEPDALEPLNRTAELRELTVLAVSSALLQTLNHPIK